MPSQQERVWGAWLRLGDWGELPNCILPSFQEGGRQARARKRRSAAGSDSLPWGDRLHGGEQWGGVVRDVVQVGANIKAVNHVVGVSLPGHPEVGSSGARSLGIAQTQHTYALPPEAWESGTSVFSTPLSS